MKLEEYMKGRVGRMTDRELMKELGMSKGAIYRAKKRLKKAGECYEVKSRRGGTWYGAKSGAKSGAEANIPYIGNNSNRERDACARECSPELGEVMAAWGKYRGRALIEGELAEMASWREKLGTGRLIELIAKAWDRCTADGMSMYYMRHYFIEPELSGAKVVGQKSGAKKVRKHEPAAAKITAQEEQRNGLRERIRADVEPTGEKPVEGNGRIGGDMREMSRVAVPEKDISGTDAVRESVPRPRVFRQRRVPL